MNKDTAGDISIHQGCLHFALGLNHLLFFSLLIYLLSFFDSLTACNNFKAVAASNLLFIT